MLYNAQGNPIPEPAAAVPPTNGVSVLLEAADRSAYDVSRGITPARIDQIMCAANGGDTEQQARLSIEVEEKNWDIGQTIATRRDAVAGLPWTIEPPEGLEDNAQAKQIAAELKAALDAAGTDELLSFPKLMHRSLLLGLIPGTAAAEIIWADGGARILGFQHLPAWALSFRNGLRRPHLLVSNVPNGVPLPVGKFIVHSTPGASGDPARGGLIRPLAWLYCFANLNIKDLLCFVERYGMPFLMARVDASAYETERTRLAALIRNFGSAGGAVFTKSVEAQLLQSQLGAADVYFKLLEYLGAAVAKVVLGQTATSGDASGWSKGGAQAAVRQDIMESDCNDLATTLGRELFQPWTRYNRGEKAPVPRIVFHTAPPEDTEKLATTLQTLSNAGLEVQDPDEVSAKIGIKLQRKAAAPPAAPVLPIAKDALPLAAESADPAGDLAAGLARELAVPETWLAPVAKLLAQIEAKAANKSVTDADLLAFAESAARQIPELFADMDVAALTDLFEKAMGAAVIDGTRAGLRKGVA